MIESRKEEGQKGAKRFMNKTRHKVILFAGILFTAFATYGFIKLEEEQFKIARNLDIFYTLFRELNLFYVDEVDPEKLVEEGIQGMLDGLDPYTTYISEEDMEDFKFMTTGQYGGIGAIIRKSGDYTIIAEPYEGFPAQKAGLKAGDVLIEIDGKSVKGLDVSEVSELLKGTPQTEMQLLIKRPGFRESKEMKKKVIREIITINNVPYAGMVDDKTGYIRISNFTQNLSEEVKSALSSLKNESPDMEGVILDLRNNPGGLLIEAVRVSNIFISEGNEIVSTRGKLKKYDSSYETTDAATDTTIKVAVLVSRGSASASEIVAGAIQDLDRGIVLGQKTFGKGLVQTTRPLSYNTQLKVTTAKYYIPSGRCIQALDYSHRNEDGSVGYVPDSLISEFTTANGRKVYDGGGIMPDISFESPQPSRIAISLYTKNLIFDYATEYAAEHDSIPAPEKFDINDEIFDDFVAFLGDKDYDYTTKSDEKLKELMEVAKEEKYFRLAEDEFEALKEKLSHDKEKDLRTFKDEIKELLYEEIVGRYYYQKGKIKATLKYDPQLEEAIEILNNTAKYDSILSPDVVVGGKVLAKK